ncbi:polyprenyl synthetase family protein [Streptomyces sp. NPDC006739]|uniref:polyprenyl synthetase family protein n=1 Tax=Streptomyces sp. NPDC006739 TaxID=3364763 RepID=UPI00367BB13D
MAAFIEAQRRSAGPRLPTEVPHVLGELLAADGKRIRPLLCVLGWQAAGGAGDAEQVVQVAAALEMLHAFTLIHDDVMDHSELRRGQPTVHHTQAIRFAPGRSPAEAEELGKHTAVLIGNLALCWSDGLLHTARLTLEQSARVLPLIDDMGSEVFHPESAGSGPGVGRGQGTRAGRARNREGVIVRHLWISLLWAVASPVARLRRLGSGFGRQLGVGEPSE